MNNKFLKMRCFFLTIVLSFCATSTVALELSVEELEATLGPKACAGCHKEETRAWKKTQHFRTYKEIPRKRIAKSRAKKMRFKQIKTDSLCIKCHFTSVQSGSRFKAVSGISCESCHGASKNWIEIHSNFGGRGTKAIDETPDHKQQRHSETETNGLIQISNIYDTGKNCYSCHTVPEEKLVNLGRHAAGSDFELVQWSQGEIRHNLWYDESSNTPLTIDRLRIKYIVGKALDIEYSLRGLVKASHDGVYFKEMVNRKERALSDLKQIVALSPIEEMQSIINLTETLDFRVNNNDYESVSERVGQLNRTFATQNDATQLSAIDSLLPTPGSYKGDVYQP